MVKGEKQKLDRKTESQSQRVKTDDSGSQAHTDRRVLRSRYLAVKSLINDQKEEISKADSNKFKSIIGEVESLHQLVQKPREQVADAEALLDIANTLVTSVRSQNNEGITPSDFISSLMKDFRVNGAINGDIGQNTISWKEIGITVSHIFKKAPGLCTMLGPMDTELKQRKAVIQRKRTRPGVSTKPEEVNETVAEQKTDTDKNMLTMFDILRRWKRVPLENLVLNRNSFSETVENIFALSFLVKDGRAEITLDDNGHHFVVPRNAPAANMISSGEVSYSHFVFRFDFKDWKKLVQTHSEPELNMLFQADGWSFHIMKDQVVLGEELMPCRGAGNTGGSATEASYDANRSGWEEVPETPLERMTRKRAHTIEETVA